MTDIMCHLDSIVYAHCDAVHRLYPNDFCFSSKQVRHFTIYFFSALKTFLS